MTQGKSLEELEANINEVYLLMAMDNVPEQYETKEIVDEKSKEFVRSLERQGCFLLRRWIKS